MHRRLVPLLALSSLLAAPAGAAAQDDPDLRPGIAVMRFDNAGSHGDDSEAEDFESLEAGLQVMLTTELAQNPALRLVERSEVESLMDEQELGTEGRIEPSTAAEIGRLVGARYMVMGSFVDVFGQVRMDARIVDVETGELVRARGVQDRREQIYDILIELASAVTDGLELPSLPEEIAEAREDREPPPFPAVMLYSQAIDAQDAGNTAEARELLERVTTEWPDYVEARQMLEQLPTG